MLLPLGVRVLEKVTRVVDAELRAVGCQKLDMPLLLPAALWRQSGRWESAGPEMLRLADRRGAEFCLAPTHEEAFTALVAAEVSSHKQLPLRLYQIGRSRSPLSTHTFASCAQCNAMLTCAQCCC